MARKRRGVIITIPREIIIEILYRLPSKSIGRFRSVSKEWLFLLTEPAFIKTHQNTLNRNLLIFKSFHGSLSLLPFHQNHVEEAILSTPKKYPPFDFDVLDVRGCCNGLVLLSALFYKKHRLIVLNPTTKDFLELPVCNCCFDMYADPIHSKDCFLCGFGYDSVTDDYKVVAIFFNKRIHFLLDPIVDVPTVHVYSLRTNTWKHVIDFPYTFYWGMSLSSVFANGNIHWLAKKGSGYLQEIVAFSLADENISEVPSPDNILASDFCKLVDLGGKLGIFQELKGEVWLMNEYGVKESWTKISLHGIHDIQTVFYKDGKIVVVRHDLMLIYNVEEKSLYKRKATTWESKDLIPKAICVESLVSPKYGLTN